MTIWYLLPPLLALADFATGRDYFAKAKLPGRSIWYVAPAVCLLLWLIDGRLAIIGVSWALWRSVLGWSSFGGALDPRTWQQALGLFVRNLVSSIPLAAALHFALGWTWPWIAVGVVAFCIWADLLNLWLTSEADKGRDADPAVDALHGFGLGTLVLIGQLFIEQVLS